MFETVRKIIAEQFNVDESELKLSTKLQEDLGADSLDAVEVIMAIEEEFHVVIEDEVYSNIKTIEDICNYLEKTI